MSLKIRRGTNADRLTITPLEGELIYTTDGKSLYVGDGSTVGGNIIHGIGYTGSAAIGYTGSASTVVGYTGSASTVVGYTGSAGSSGTGNGYTGSVGYTGSAGAGYTGSVGYTGSSGAGYTGSVGYTGSSGYVGSAPSYYVGSFTGSLYGYTGSILINGSSGNFHANNMFNGYTGSLLIDNTGNFYPSKITLSTGEMLIEGPKNGIHIITEGTSNDDYNLFSIISSHNSSESSIISYTRSRGNSTNQLSVLPGDSILGTYYAAYTSNSKNDVGIVASVEAFVDPNGTVSTEITPGLYTISTTDSMGNLNVNLSIDKNGLIGLADNTLVSGSNSGQVNTSSVTKYLKITVGGTNYALPLYSIRP